MSATSSFRLNRPESSLPSEYDFDPFGCLDSRSAWDNFGELSLAQAYDLFLTNPLHYQEDFMFMGCRAFTYYFPVIDRYLRSTKYEDDWDDCSAAILGSGVEAQFDWNNAILIPTLLDEIEDLSSFVKSSVKRYSVSEDEQDRILKVWSKVDKNLAKYRS